MTQVKVTGRHQKVAKEEIRAMVQATLTVLEFHHLSPRVPVVKVRIVPQGTLGKNDLSEGDNAGMAYPEGTWDGHFEMADHHTYQDTLTVIIHETIHLCVDVSEKCTSTLTGRIKPDVAKLTDILVGGTYRRAGFFAHLKISYPKTKDGKDYYDRSQYRKVQTEQAGKKYRDKPLTTFPDQTEGTVA